MPNWTSNSIYAEGSPEQISEFLEKIKGERGVLDFNSIIPMPELLRHTGSGHRTINGEKVETWYVINKEAIFPKDDDVRLFTRKEKAQLAEIGFNSWYDWSIHHWGTKWNACDAAIDDEDSAKYGYVRITYQTAWSEPQPILQKLREMFPHLSITFRWRHEDESEYPHTLQFDAEETAGAA